MRKALDQPGQDFATMHAGPFNLFAIQRCGHKPWRPGYRWRVVPCNAYGVATRRYSASGENFTFVSHGPLYDTKAEAVRALALRALAGDLDREASGR